MLAGIQRYSRLSRNQERKEFELPVQVSLLNTDMDDNDEEKESIRGELAGIRRILTGVLISTATAALLFAVNVVLKAVGE